MSEAHTQNGSQNGHGSKPSTAHLTTTPFPASRKVHVDGAQPGVRVPMREISLTPTHSTNGNGGMPNQPITVYDTSGPYTDPHVTIDVRAGLQPAPSLDRSPAGYGRTSAGNVPVWTSTGCRSKAGGPAVYAYPQTAPRQSRPERQPDALCQEGHRHAGDGIYRDPGKPITGAPRS